MGAPRQTYHLEPPRGLMNDPNGLSFFGGRYHAFFQWNRFAKDHTHKEWGYFTSADLAHWAFQGSALLPDQPYDHSGVQSGSAIVLGDELLLYYTGSDKASTGRRTSQCLATTQDGKTFVKEGVIIPVPQGYTRHFRDPKVWRTDDGALHMVLGAQRANGKGAVALLSSDDARNWQLVGNLGTSDAVEMIECPDLFELDGSTILTSCPQHRDNATDTCGESHAEWKTLPGTALRPGAAPVSLDGGSRLDLGFDLYAPQTFQAPDGRRILMAWMSRLADERERQLGEGSPSIHCLTIPRELSVREGSLVQAPVRELETLLRPEVTPRASADGLAFTGLAGQAFCLRMADEEGIGTFAVTSHGGAARIIYTASTGTLALRRTWPDGEKEDRATQVGKLTSLEVWSDESSVEVFANGGMATLSARVLPLEQAHGVTISGHGAAVNPRLQEIDRTSPAIFE